MMTDSDATPVGMIRPIEAGRPVAPQPGPDGFVEDDEYVEYVDGLRRRKRKRTWVVRLVVALVVIFLLIFGYFLVSLYQVWSTGRHDQARQVDAIVVLGAAQYDGKASPQLAARLDQVLRLWPEGYAPLVIATGGKQPGDRFTEAQTSGAYLTKRGIPQDAILLENEGSNTYESLQAVAAALERRDLHSVLIVTDPYHALRSRLIAEDVGLEAYTSPTTSSVVSGGERWKRNVQEAGGVMLGRIFGFDRL
jgi:uncharacterized SAM-binding protein YcdF (DUF218 family)